MHSHDMTAQSLGTIERYPAGKFYVAILASAVVISWLTINPYRAHVLLRESTDRNIRVTELCGTILHLDEVLTMSARMAAATGDRIWEERYRAHALTLDSAIKEAFSHTKDVQTRKFLENADAANIELVDLENQSFLLTSQGKMKPARSLLFGEKYLKQKQAYADGLRNFIEALRLETKEGLRLGQRHSLLKTAVALLFVAALLVLWLRVLALLRSWRKDAELKNTELARLNAALDRKVDEQSRAIVIANEQLQQAQKLESIGRLAGGIAHDFNNILTSILGFATFLKKDLEAGTPRKEDVDEIITSGKRAAALTRQLLAFSRKQLLEPKILDLNALVGNMEKMIARLIGENIIVETFLEAGLSRVKVDPGQLEQVLLNLAVNASDAMPRGGKLTIETSIVDLDETYALGHAGVQAGRYVQLAVSDTGDGMDEVVQARIFEPFFTTKAPGKGTGLGLATVYGIVKQSEGHIGAYSAVGRGTTFKVYLPATDQAPVAEPEVREDDIAKRGDETVLLVEDEAGVRKIARRILISRGYTVLEAETGEDAQRVSGAYPGEVDLLVSDLIMPGMDGLELAKSLAGLRPRMKVLLMSGYTDKAVHRRELASADMHFLQKPFATSDFARKVRAVLDAEALVKD